MRKKRGLKKKRDGLALAFKTFVAKDKTRYLVFKLDGSFHVFVECEAKEAARDCGAPEPGRETTMQQMWESLWKKQSDESA